MNKEIQINIFDEIGDDIILESTGNLDIETGAVKEIVYAIPQSEAPFKNPDYDFSYGLIKLNGKELEFTLEAQKNGDYRVPANELGELREKAIQLLSKSLKVKP